MVVKSLLLFSQYVYLALIKRIEENKQDGREAWKNGGKKTFKASPGTLCLVSFCNDQMEFTLTQVKG
jgi:hypothetical protein